MEAINDAFHVELERDPVGHGHGRGRRARRRRLPRDRGPARPFRARPLRRHAARGSGDPRFGRRPVHGRLAAGLRDAVRRLQLPVPRPADHPRGALPLAHRREDGVPDHYPHALRRRGPRARAARRLARGLLRAHAGREGRDPVHARGREGAARRGDPRSRSRRRARAEAPLPHDARRGSRGRASRPAREGADRARGLRPDARRLRVDGAAGRAGGGRAGRRGERGGARHPDAQAARRGCAAGLRRQDRAGS